jgi:hypothetical protein
VLAASIIRAMAASTYEMSVNFYQTTGRNIPEDSRLNNRRRENLKSHSRWLLDKTDRHFLGLGILMASENTFLASKLQRLFVTLAYLMFLCLMILISFVCIS